MSSEDTSSAPIQMPLLSPAMVPTTNDDLSWIPDLEFFLSGAQIPSVEAANPNPAPVETSAKIESQTISVAERASRKRKREKERRDQLNAAFKKLSALMTDLEPTYKPNVSYSHTNLAPTAQAGINQPYLIAKTTEKIRSLHEQYEASRVEIEETEREIERIKSGEVAQNAFPSIEKSDEEKRQLQSMMMMMPIMISPADWMMNMMGSMPFLPNPPANNMGNMMMSGVNTAGVAVTNDNRKGGEINDPQKQQQPQNTTSFARCA